MRRNSQMKKEPENTLVLSMELEPPKPINQGYTVSLASGKLNNNGILSLLIIYENKELSRLKANERRFNIYIGTDKPRKSDESPYKAITPLIPASGMYLITSKTLDVRKPITNAVASLISMVIASTKTGAVTELPLLDNTFTLSNKFKEQDPQHMIYNARRTELIEKLSGKELVGLIPLDSNLRRLLGGYRQSREEQYTLIKSFLEDGHS